MMASILRSYGARVTSIRRERFPNYTYLSSSSSHEECNSSDRHQTLTVSYPITADSAIVEPSGFVSNIKLNVSSNLNRLGTNNSNDNNNNTTGASNIICLSLQKLPRLMKKFNKYSVNMLNDIKFKVNHLSDILTSFLEQSDDKGGALNEVVSLLMQIKCKLKFKATTTIMQQILNEVVQQKWLKMLRDIDIASNITHNYYYWYSSYFNFVSLAEKLRFCLSLLYRVMIFVCDGLIFCNFVLLWCVVI